MPPLTRGQRQLAAAQAQNRAELQARYRQQGRQNIDNVVLREITRVTTRLENIKRNATIYINHITGAFLRDSSIRELARFGNLLVNITAQLNNERERITIFLESYGFPQGTDVYIRSAEEIENQLLLKIQVLEREIYKKEDEI